MSDESTSHHAEGPLLPTQPQRTWSTVNGGQSTSNFFSLNPRAPEFAPPKVSTSFIVPQPSSASLPAAPVSGRIPDSSIDSNPPAATSKAQTSFAIEPGAPTASSVTSHFNRLTAPPLLKIDTNTSSSSSSNPSPGLPPTPKLPPVSLPSTPGILPPNPLVVHLRSALEPRGSLFSTSSRDILSPLTVGTPNAGNAKTLQNFTPLSTPQGSQIFQKLPSGSVNGKGKEPYRSMYDDVEVIEDMKKNALAFLQKSLLVKNTFARWLKRTMDRAAWQEACRHGDEYRQKINSQSRHSSVHKTPRPVTPPEKKRQISMNGVDLSPLKKRIRKRISADYRPPRTDEDLVKRFTEVCTLLVPWFGAFIVSYDGPTFVLEHARTRTTLGSGILSRSL